MWVETAADLFKMWNPRGVYIYILYILRCCQSKWVSTPYNWEVLRYTPVTDHESLILATAMPGFFMLRNVWCVNLVDMGVSGNMVSPPQKLWENHGKR
jgi:hypothetical protein